MRLFGFCALAALMASVAFAADAPPPFSLSIAGARLTASGVTPNGEVIWYGRLVGSRGGVPDLIRQTAVLRDDNGDGVVTFDAANLSLPAVWVAVDFETGRHALLLPSGPSRLLELPDDAWRGGKAHVDVPRNRVELLLVRPKVGAWTRLIWQGGADDADGRNDANLRAALGAMTRLHGTAEAPPTATPRDVLIVVDPRELYVFARQAE